MNEQQIRAEIAELRGEISDRAERVSYLELLLSSPCVTPVVHYDRFYQRVEEDFDVFIGDCDVAAAFRHLESMSEWGLCDPVGVSVGGAFIGYGEWRLKENP